MMVLAEHRAETAHLPHQPLDHIEALAQIGGQELAGLLRQIDQDRTGFEDLHRRAAVGGLLVDDRRHAVVRRECKKLRLELVTGADVDRVDLVGEARFLEKHRDLVAIRRRPVIEIDHLAILEMAA